MTSQQIVKKMKAEKLLDYLMEENNIHYQHYCIMKEFMLSYQLPVTMLKTTDEPKTLFDKLLLSYRNPPSKLDSKIIENTSEFEEIIKCNQEIRGFNERMFKEVVGFVNVYNNLIMDKLCKDKSDSPTSWNNMKDTMKRLIQNQEEWKAERDNLEGELFILSNEKCETEERELSALRTKIKLQNDLQCANEIISNLEKSHSCCEQKMKKKKEKKSLPKRILRFFCKKLKKTKQRWEEDGENIKSVSQNMHQDIENSDEDTENSYNVMENEDEDTTNSYNVMENGDEDTENSDEDIENCYSVMENGDQDLENSDSFMENSDDDMENSDSSMENGDKDRGIMSKDMGELSFLKKQKSDMDHWSKEVEKQLEEARDFKRKYKQYIEVLEKEAKAIKKASMTNDNKSSFKNSAAWKKMKSFFDEEISSYPRCSYWTGQINQKIFNIHISWKLTSKGVLVVRTQKLPEKYLSIYNLFYCFSSQSKNAQTWVSNILWLLFRNDHKAPWSQWNKCIINKHI